MSNNTPQPVPLTVTKIQPETHDTNSFFFLPSTALHFLPGQFINIGVEINGKMHYRSYSISSLPTDAEIQLTIKRVDQGLVSNWLNDHLAIGDQIQSHGIAGNFNIARQPFKRSIIFISAGCGISPIYAMYNHIINTQLDNVEQIIFIHCARDTENIIFAKACRDMAIHCPKVTPIIFLDKFKDGPYLQGPLNESHLKAYLQTMPTNEHSIFLCGPTGFMESVKQSLITLNFDMNLFQEESFSSASVASTSTAMDSDVAYQVSVPDFDVTITTQAGKVLLDVLQENNIPIIAACRSGMCGSCKCKVMSGSVEVLPQVVDNGVLTQQDVDKGYTLACSSRIQADVSIEIM